MNNPTIVSNDSVGAFGAEARSVRRLVVVVGNPRPSSRTHAVAEKAARALASEIPGSISVEIVDLTLLAPRLLRSEPCVATEDALERVATADFLIVASPTYKGTYTGLLKVFLDRLPGAALAGTVAFPLLVMGSARHALAVEVHLRPLLVELGATVPTPGLAILESDLDRLEEVLEKWTHTVGAIV
jgi:FMN reductase